MRLKWAIGTLLASMCGVQPVAAESVVMSMPIAVVAIYPGDPLTASLFEEKRVRVSRRAVGSYYADVDRIVGKVAARAIAPGSAVALNAVREPHVFKEGARVRIVYQAEGLEIRAQGIALQAGVVGMPVNVRNADTGTVVRGTVGGDGSVVLDSD